MRREQQHCNVYRALTKDTKEQLRVAILDLVCNVLQEQREKTGPTSKFIMQTLSEDIRRLVAKLDDGIKNRHLFKDYIAVYFGTQGKQDYFIQKLSVESIVDLKKIVIENKPEWALRAAVYPIAYKIPEDDFYPFEMVWPKIEDYKERSRDSIPATASRTGARGPRGPRIPKKA